MLHLAFCNCLYNTFFQIEKNLTYLFEKFFLYILLSTLLCKDNFHQLLYISFLNFVYVKIYSHMYTKIWICKYTFKVGSIPGSESSPGEGNDYPLQYSGLENSMNYVIHRFTKSCTWLSAFHFHTILNNCF